MMRITLNNTNAYHNTQYTNIPSTFIIIINLIKNYTCKECSVVILCFRRTMGHNCVQAFNYALSHNYESYVKYLEPDDRVNGVNLIKSKLNCV